MHSRVGAKSDLHRQNPLALGWNDARIRIEAKGDLHRQNPLRRGERGLDPFGLGQRRPTWQIFFATLVRNTTWVDIVEQYIGLMERRTR